MSMSSRFRRRWVESPALIVVFVLLLCGAGTALAASGVGSLVTKGEDGAVTARGAQQALGSRSATPPVETGTPPAATEVVGNQEGKGDNGAVLDTKAGNLGDTAAGGTAGASKLPFTGFLAIPLLILGAAMLLGGVALRRRNPRLA